MTAQRGRAPMFADASEGRSVRAPPLRDRGPRAMRRESPRWGTWGPSAAAPAPQGECCPVATWMAGAVGMIKPAQTTCNAQPARARKPRSASRRAGGPAHEQRHPVGLPLHRAEQALQTFDTERICCLGAAAAARARPRRSTRKLARAIRGDAARDTTRPTLYMGGRGAAHEKSSAMLPNAGGPQREGYA